MQIIFNLSRDYLTGYGEDGAQNGRIARTIVVGLRSQYDVIETSDMEELAGIVIEPGVVTVCWENGPTCVWEVPYSMRSSKELNENNQSTPPCRDFHRHQRTPSVHGIRKRRS